MRLIWAGLLVGSVLWGSGKGPNACAPEELERELADEAVLAGDAADALQLLNDPAQFAETYRALRARHADLEPDHVACLLAGRLGKEETAAKQVSEVVEAYRDIGEQAFTSMVLMGLFRAVEEPVLRAIVEQYTNRACSEPEPGEFERRVAADALASTSEGNRERFIESVIRLYGPGSAVHYKIEANDCLFLVDQALAQAALGTLPEKKRKQWEPLLAAFYE